MTRMKDVVDAMVVWGIMLFLAVLYVVLLLGALVIVAHFVIKWW
jgi:hypothetical protein